MGPHKNGSDAPLPWPPRARVLCEARGHAARRPLSDATSSWGQNGSRRCTAATRPMHLCRERLPESDRPALFRSAPAAVAAVALVPS
jgi:hypothetical protein